MKGGPKSSLRPFLHRALQLINACFGKCSKHNLKPNSNIPKSFSQLSSCSSSKVRMI